MVAELPIESGLSVILAASNGIPAFMHHKSKPKTHHKHRCTRQYRYYTVGDDFYITVTDILVSRAVWLTIVINIPWQELIRRYRSLALG